MHCEQELAKDLYWIGGDDKRLGIFEGHHPVPDGMAYNNYLLLDEKTVLLDTIDRAVEERFLETLEYLLGERELDYIIVQHMEPDHSATLKTVVQRHPNAKIICTATCKTIITQFFGGEMGKRCETVKDGDSLEAGTRTLAFATAPMVHWPEVMVTYDVEDKILFSADAFGSFGALDGRLFDDMYDFETELLDESRRYYANIVGKYGTQVTELLDKADTLDIELICPLHGPLIRNNIGLLMEKYRLWAAYEPEDDGVVVAYASVYGGTRDVAEKLAFKLSDSGIHDLALYDLSITDPSYVLSEAFRVGNIVLASVTYNAGLFPKMTELVDCMVEHNLRRRRFSFIENGSWGLVAGKKMMEAIEAIPEATRVGELFTIKSRMKTEQDEELDALAAAIVDSIKNPQPEVMVPIKQIAPAPEPIVGAVRPPAPAPAKVRAGAAMVPIAPGMEEQVLAARAAMGITDEAPQQKEQQEEPKTKVIQIWRCTFCGYQAEVPAGTDMSTFVCPVCLKSGEGRFILVREKVVPA